MASVLVDTDAEATTTNSLTLSFNVTVAANSNRFLLVNVASWDPVPATAVVSSVTANGRGMSLHRQQDDGLGNTVSQWGLIAPDTGVNAIFVTMTGTCDEIGAGAVSLYRCHQVDPIGATTGAFGTSTTPSVSLAATSGDLVIDCLYYSASGASIAVNSGQTQLANSAIVPTSFFGSSSEPGDVSVTVGWTNAGSSVNWSQSAVVIAQETSQVSITLSTVGAGTWQNTIPGLTVLDKVETWGGGAAGAQRSTNGGGAGGGGGEYAKRLNVPVTYLSNYGYTVGAGGTDGAVPVAGGDSQFTGDLGVTCIARGAPVVAAESQIGGTGGTGGTGDTLFAGGAGANGTAALSGGGGEGGGNAATGSAGVGTVGGVGGAGGNGGDGKTVDSNGSPGGTRGGGGGGGFRVTGTRTGGLGGRGEIVLTYTIPSGVSGDFGGPMQTMFLVGLRQF